MHDPWRREPGAQPLIFAHRGLARDVFENTLAAYQAALDAGVDGIEIDVSQTADGRLVCFHDDDLMRISGVKEKLRSTPYRDLRSIPLEGHERVPTLDEAFDVIGTQVPIILDVKYSHRFDFGIVEPLTRLLRRRQAECSPNVTVSSFNYLLLDRLVATLPWLRIGFIMGPDSRHAKIGMWKRFSSRYHAVHPSRSLVSSLAVEKWRRRGWTVVTWTVNEPDEARRVADAGVDVIITDDPTAITWAP